VDLRQLSYLVAVGDEGGIRAAARRLRISQPQISQALRRLEEELGVELMRRSARGIELTPEGVELVGHGREILDRVGHARTALKRMALNHTSTLRVGIVNGVLSAGELLAPILDEFRERRPDIELRLEEIGYDQIAPLLDGTIDVGVVRTPVAHPDLKVVPVAEEPRVVMVGATHELAQETSVTVEQLLPFPSLPLSARPEWAEFWQLDAERGHANVATDVAPTSNVPEAQMAIATQGVMITSPANLLRLAPNPLIRMIPVTDATPTTIAIACGRRDTRSAVRDFIAAAETAVQRDIALLPGGTLPGG
jgi:DNA-binding transcriptional LysR family regulator